MLFLRINTFMQPFADLSIYPFNWLSILLFAIYLVFDLVFWNVIFDTIISQGIHSKYFWVLHVAFISGLSLPQAVC